MIAVLGCGASLPDKVITNFDLEMMVETSDEWIVQRSGIRQRRSADGPILPYALAAAREAMSEAGVTPAELGFILCATVSPDRTCPNMANDVAAELGAICPAMDISAACSGFPYGLHTASRLFDDAPILLIGAERLTNLVNYSDRTTCFLFGDGAGAVVLGRRKGSGLLASRLFAFPDNKQAITIAPFDSQGGLTRIAMNGRAVYRFATIAFQDALRAALSDAQIPIDRLDWLVPHQANGRIIEAAVQQMGIPMEKVIINIDRTGNTSAASIPVALHELWRSGKLKRGDTLAMAAFGGGLTSGAAVFRW